MTDVEEGEVYQTRNLDGEVATVRVEEVLDEYVDEYLCDWLADEDPPTLYEYRGHRGDPDDRVALVRYRDERSDADEPTRWSTKTYAVPTGALEEGDLRG